MSNLKNILESALSSSVGEAYLPAYIHEVLGGVISRQQAQNYAKMFIAYEDFTASPSAYDGQYRGLFENLGADFERGLQAFVREADIGNADYVSEFLDGLNALEAHVVDGVKLEDALEEYGRGEEIAGDLDRDQVIADDLHPLNGSLMQQKATQQMRSPPYKNLCQTKRYSNWNIA